MSHLTKLRGAWRLVAKLGKYAAVILTILLLFFTFAFTTDRDGNFSWPREYGRIGIFEQLAK